MIVLTSKGHKEFLDETLLSSTCRIEVEEWQPICPVDALYFRREQSPRVVLAYVREIGLRATMAKVRSRLDERDRNDRWISVGWGKVSESSEGGPTLGEAVLFVAPSHPRCMDRVVLHTELVRPRATIGAVPISRGVSWFEPCNLIGVGEPDLQALAGWVPMSGLPLDRAVVERTLDAFTEVADRGEPQVVQRSRRISTVEGQRRPDRRRVVIMGYGNYVKSVIEPSIPNGVDVQVHDIDPLQLRKSRRVSKWSTSPWVPDDLTASDIVVIASFHHTHAGLATAAMAAGATVIVEKPPASDAVGLRELGRAIESGGRLAVAYQRRFSPLNRLIDRDLGPDRAAVHMHCMVYEEPLPDRHWYTWPASGGPIVSNGCHWIDYFLYLNPRTEVHSSGARRLGAGHLAWLVLKNGAEFSMSITDKGSPRLGMRDVVHLRSERAAIQIVDQRHYTAERADGSVRKMTTKRLRSHRLMYESLFKAALTDSFPDDRYSALYSTQVTLMLAGQIARQN